MNAATQRVLVVEDDPAIARVLELELGEAGYRVEVAPAGSDGLAAMERDRPDLVVLDVRLPDMDGLSVCRRARRSGHDMPILMLTALDRVGDRVVGLDAGADDYLAKPFAIEELLARLRALSRRAGSDQTTLEAGPVRLDLESREVSVDGAPVELTAREFDLLAFLMHAPGRVFTRAELIDRVWGDGFAITDRTVDSHVKALRRKVSEAGADPALIETVRGVGYRAVETPSQEILEP